MAKRTKAPKDDKSIVAPSVRVFTEWDPRKLRAAARSAESGNLHYAVAVCDWLLTDDGVVGALDTRADALLGLEPSFEASGDKRRSDRVVKALEAGEDWWTAYPESELRTMLQWGLLLGISLHRHGWQERVEHAGRLLPMPAFWHPQTLRYDFQARTWFARDDKNIEHIITPGDGEWILHTPKGASRPWAKGYWLSLARWVLLKHYAILDWARHGEKAALLVATAQAESTQKQRKELAEDLSASGSDRVVALAAGFDLKLIEVAANTENIYRSQIEAADSAITILIRGGNLTSKVEEGSRAAAEVQERTGDQAKLRFDAQSISTTLHDQSLAWWAEFNFGDRGLAPWPVWPVKPEEDRQRIAEVAETAARGLKAHEDLGFEVDEKAYRETYGFTYLKGRKSDEQRAKDAAERFERQQALIGAQPARLAPREGNARARMLASGASLAANSGFVQGQQYVDDLADAAVQMAAEQIEPTLEQVLVLVDEATSLEDLDAALAKLYVGKLDPERFAELTERVHILAELAGRVATLQDI